MCDIFGCCLDSEDQPFIQVSDRQKVLMKRLIYSAVVLCCVLGRPSHAEDETLPAIDILQQGLLVRLPMEILEVLP